MKKTISLLLALAMCLSLCACGSAKQETGSAEKNGELEASANSETQVELMSKEDMLSSADPLTRDEVDKSINNIAFAKSLIGNVYTFAGNIWSVEEDHAVITFYIQDENGNYVTAANVMVANLYLPLDELITLGSNDRLFFVGKLDDVSTHEESFPGMGTEKVVDMIFKSAAIVSDRFEESGKLHSKNENYSGDRKNAWYIEYPNNPYLSAVFFAEDVSAYKGQTITYSYKVVDGAYVDAQIVK